ncbi:MAG: PD40 domain-containing protein [Nitrospirae bacterium]|nr:PD40 domain-containing protein [Nitrospirota bacterium]
MYGVMLIIIIGISSILCADYSFGFGSNYTHPAITASAVDSMLKDRTLERYLKDDIDLKDGLGTQLVFHPEVSDSEMIKQVERNNKVFGKSFRRQFPTRSAQPYSAEYLLVSGSEAEDHPTERSQHHFHDPVSNSGLDNNYYGVGIFADFLALFYPSAEQSNAGRLICSIVSLCEPGFDLNGTSAVDRVTGKASDAYPHNYFAWPDTRRYFYNALTAKTKDDREHNYAMTFFSLGHSLHMLEDMAVPAHTRNDFLYDHIWHGIMYGSYLEGFVEDGRKVGNDSLTNNKITFSKLSYFWDNDGSQAMKGLAEYSNNNFLSEGTVFQKYDSPDWIDIVKYEIVAEDGKTDDVRYYRGRTSDGIDIPHLAVVGLLNPILNLFSDREKAGKTAYLDPNCYKDYSDILIPKAVAYASGLTEYFFRGRLAVIKDGADAIKIKNLSEEPLNEGIIEIYYDSATTGTREMISTFIISADHPIDPGGITERIVMEAPTDNIEKGRYVVIFKGRLGEEYGAVIGKVHRDRLMFISNRNGTSEVYTMSPDLSNLKTILPNTDANIVYTHPAGSPDGTKIAIHSNRENSDGIYIFDLVSGSINWITEGYWPSWSPDGRQLVYSKNTGIKSDIYIINIDTNEETRLTDDSYNNLWPSWSPDGSRIAYTSQLENKTDIIVVELSSRLAQNLTASLDNHDRWKPAWSPDGRRIAYEKPTKVVYDVNEPWYVNVHVLDIYSGTEINVTNTDINNSEHGVWNGTPAWIDNERIVLESNVSGELWSDLWAVDAGGIGFIMRLTDSKGHDGYPFMW